jgi:hypothetical protein
MAPQHNKARSWGDFSGSKQGTSYDEVSAALNGFCGSRNVEGEMLSASSILCLARQAFLAPVPKETTEILQGTVYFSFWGIMGLTIEPILSFPAPTLSRSPLFLIPS